MNSIISVSKRNALAYFAGTDNDEDKKGFKASAPGNFSSK